MNMDTIASQKYEQILINTMRILPSERVEQLVDFARFLQAQSLSDQLMQEENSAAVAADNARWDALLATNQSQDLLEKLADEALAEYRAGKAQPMRFDDAGRMIIPQ